jgi:P pilus assembly chaperone PapD
MKMKKISYLILLLTLIIPSYSSAQGGALVLNPNRIVFEGRDRKAELLVNNPSDETQTYRVTFENMVMLDDGKYQNVKEKDKNGKYSEDYIRYSPRTFTVEPRASQTVRLMLRKSKNMEDGEYRSHMKVSVVPKAEAPKIQESDSVNINIQVHYGITIPVIVRKGDLSYKTELESFEIVDTEREGYKKLKARINRVGDRSVYGDISLIHYDSSGKSTVLKFLPGVSIFTPNTHRNFDLDFEVPEGVDLSEGKVEVKYVDRQTGQEVASKTQNL